MTNLTEEEKVHYNKFLDMIDNKTPRTDEADKWLDDIFKAGLTYRECYKLEKETILGWMCYGIYDSLSSVTLAHTDAIASNPEKNFRVVKEIREIINVS
jgi:rubrerythrin